MSNLSDIVIFVRSYKRYEQVKTHTLKFLDDNNLLHMVILLVADKAEESLYIESLGEMKNSLLDIWVTEKGGGFSNNNALKRVPLNHKVFMMDDDIKTISSYPDGGSKNPVKITNLIDYLNYGYEMMAKSGAGMFGFNYMNMFYKQGKGFITIGQNRITGGFWGAFNCEELQVDSDHEDDTIRSAQVMHKFGTTITFNWIGCSMAPIGKNPGGMQADGSRDDTKAICNNALKKESVKKFFQSEPEWRDQYQNWSLKPINKNKLKKEKYYIKAKEVGEFGDYVPDDIPTNLFSI